ncbi:MAG: hypothetical protein ACE5GH_04020 [Fidelibacterota bacterium]
MPVPKEAGEQSETVFDRLVPRDKIENVEVGDTPEELLRSNPLPTPGVKQCSEAELFSATWPRTGNG